MTRRRRGVGAASYVPAPQRLTQAAEQPRFHLETPRGIGARGRTPHRLTAPASRLLEAPGVLSALKGLFAGATLKGMRNDVEDSVLLRLRELIAPEVKATSQAGRGFVDQKLHALLEQLRFSYAQGERRSAAQWVPASATECLGVCPADSAGGCWREPRYGAPLKANTSQERTYSLFRQGCTYYQALPNMPEARLRPLIERFAQLVCEQLVFREAFGLL